jgi:GNAT superfamily N-acetyltransferase
MIALFIYRGGNMVICTHLTNTFSFEENFIRQFRKVWIQFNSRPISVADFTRKILSDKHHLILALENDEIAGFALCESISSPIRNSSYLELWALYVVEHYRKTGVGRMLIQEVEDFARESDCRDVHVSADTLPGVSDFYNSCGYSNYAFRMRKEVI